MTAEVPKENQVEIPKQLLDLCVGKIEKGSLYPSYQETARVVQEAVRIINGLINDVKVLHTVINNQSTLINQVKYDLDNFKGATQKRLLGVEAKQK